MRDEKYDIAKRLYNIEGVDDVQVKRNRLHVVVNHGIHDDVPEYFPPKIEEKAVAIATDAGYNRKEGCEYHNAPMNRRHESVCCRKLIFVY